MDRKQGGLTKRHIRRQVAGSRSKVQLYSLIFNSSSIRFETALMSNGL